MKYRKEIDGLRAIAIVPVLLFHTGIPYFTGGFLGVDVFFVISGFLITRIILDEIGSNKFSVINFYERRARRILPALVPVILVTAVFFPFVEQSPKILTDFGESILSVTIFLSNVYFFQTSGYFGATSELSPLLHTWSLAVEEQFYLFFPLFAMYFLPLGRKYFIYILCIIFFVSLGIAEWGWRNQPIGNFYLLPTRAWELFMGSFGAIFIDSNNLKAYKPKTKSFLSGLGLLMILISYFLFNSKTPHPSIYTLVPVTGSLLIILFSNGDNLCGKLLMFRPVVHIGLISYSLYLWHQPLLVLTKLKYSTIHLSPSTQVILLFLIYLISLLSYKYIETPFRNKTLFCKAEIYKYSSISMGAMLCVGVFYMFNISIQQIIFPEEMKRFNMLLVANNSHEHQVMYEEECKFWSPSLDKHFKDRFYGCSEKHGKALVILGGSHGMDLYNAIAMNTEHEFVVSLSRGFCRAHDFIGNMSSSAKECQYEDFKVFAKANSDYILSVVYTQTPDRLFTKKMNKATESSLSIKHVDQVVDYLVMLKNDIHLDVLMVGMLPPMLKSPIELDHTQSIEKQLTNNISDHIIVLTKYLDVIFNKKLARNGIPYISKFDGFELNFPKDFISNGQITYSDNRHLSLEGEKIFGSRLIKFLNKSIFLSKF